MQPCVAQIVLFTGSSDGRTTISIENAGGVQAAAAGTSAYWLVPLKLTAVSGSPASRPGDAGCGAADVGPVRDPLLVDERATRCAEAPVRAAAHRR